MYVKIHNPPNNTNPINLFLLYKNAGKIVPNNKYGNNVVMFGFAIIVEIVNDNTNNPATYIILIWLTLA